jgi:hypothetical protein
VGGMTPTAQKMYRKIEQQEGEIEALRRSVEVQMAITCERDETLKAIREKASELHEEIEYLRLQLESRPTMRQWSQAQRDRELLEEKLHDLVLLRGESAEIAMWRKHLSTQDRIKVRVRESPDLGLRTWEFGIRNWELGHGTSSSSLTTHLTRLTLLTSLSPHTPSHTHTHTHTYTHRSTSATTNLVCGCSTPSPRPR